MGLKNSTFLSTASLAAMLCFAPAWAAEPQAKVGEKVRDFERVDGGGKAVKLTKVLQDSKAVVVDFWSTRCPVSQKYEPVLKKLAAGYSAKGVTFLAVDSNYNEPAEEIQKVRSERGVPYPVLLDGKDGALATYFGASHTPEAYLVTPDQVLAYHGNLDEIGEALDAVLAGKAVPKSETRAFGCSIKRP
jgi:thiol-disulfide isomerase/thioredoxin